jgi:hypothetical protein
MFVSRRLLPNKLQRPAPLAFTVGFVAFAILVLTASAIPVVFDETEYLWRADRIVQWFGLWRATPSSPDAAMFSAQTVSNYWPFITYAEGHPAAAALPIAASTGLLGGTLSPLLAARIGPILLFSVACGAVAFRLRVLCGTIAAVAAAASLLTLPRLFAEAHFATLDGQLTALWLLLWVVDTGGGNTVLRALSVGAVAGLASAAKFTGFIAWVPLAVSRLLQFNRRRLALLAVSVLAGAVVFYLVNPPLWHDPIGGMRTHVRLNTERALNIAMIFFGRRYDLRESLPWYNTIAWLLIVTPLPILVLGGIGLTHAIRRGSSAERAAVMHWAALMIVRALPGTPPHDGIRLFLPAFGFWCVLAGVGAHRAWRWKRDSAGALWRFAVPSAIAASFMACAVNVARYHPQTLSHYNLLVGGLRGAARLGMEPTYWWDALDAEALDWINRNTPAGERVAFATSPDMRILRSWGLLQPQVVHRVRDSYRWYVFQNRTGFLGPAELYLLSHAVPAFVNFAGRYPPGSVPRDLDVPLLYIYTHDQYKTALRETSPGSR